MKNTERLFYTMIDTYNDYSATHNYIFVYNYKGTVYMTFLKAKDLVKFLTLDRASRGAGYSIRFKPNRAKKELLLTYGATALCSTEYFNALVRESVYNRGEIAEKIIFDFFGQQWKKDNIPFWIDGDIAINNHSYQIKYEKATLVSEKGLAKVREHLFG